MNALEKAQLRIQLEDRIPVYPERGEWYHLSWASDKYKKMRVELLSIRGEKVVVRTTTGKLMVQDIKCLRHLEQNAIANAKQRIKNNNKRRQLSI